jgi:thiol-disulfide isomerase/thioredoxin
MRAVIVSLVLLVAVASACGASATSPATRASGPPVVPLASVQSQVAGHAVVFLFTAPGCESCAAEARSLAASAADRPGIKLVGVDLSNDNPAGFAAYIKAIGLASSRFMWTIDQDGSFARHYAIVSLSSTVFIDSDGSVRFVNAGPQDDKILGDQLSQLT